MDGLIERRPKLVYSPHPLLPTKDRVLRFDAFESGETVSAYLRRQDIELGFKPVVLWVDGREIPKTEWALTVPHRDSLITVHGIVQDGGGGGSNPLRIVAMIAVLALAWFAAPALAGALGVSAGFAQGLIMVAGTMIVNALLPAPRPDLARLDGRNAAASPTYSLTGGSNQPRLYAPMPMVLGVHRIFPDLISRSYTEFQGTTQYLYSLFSFGVSDVTLTNIKLGTTDIASYTGVTSQESDISGNITLFKADSSNQVGGNLALGVTLTRTTTTATTSLSVDVGGTIYSTGTSVPTAHREVRFRWLTLTLVFTVEYRQTGTTGAWLPLGASATVNVVNNTPYVPTPVRGTVKRGGLTAAQYDVRVKYNHSVGYATYRDFSGLENYYETYTLPTSQLFYQWPVDDTYQSAQFIQVKAGKDTAATLPGIKRLAVKIKASSQLNGNLDQLSAIASAKCPVWTGLAWVTQATSNPAWWFLWFARGGTIGGRRAYGAGLPDSRIDIEQLKLWGAWCDLKALTINAVIDQPQTCAETLTIIARAGRAAPTWSSGKLGVVWDQSGLPVVAHFGMSNIKRGSFQVNYSTEQLADEVVVQFINPGKDWAQDSVRALGPGVTTPNSTATIELFGCTDSDMAGREASLLAARQVYHRRQVSFETDFEGMVCQRGDVISISHDLTSWDYSGRLVSGTASVLQLDRSVPFTPATSHYIGIRKPDGTYAIYDVDYVSGESSTLTLTTPMAFSPDADVNHPPCDYLWFFGPQATPGKKFKIIEIAPSGDRDLRLTCIDEIDAYYTAEISGYTGPSSGLGAQPVVLTNGAITEWLSLVGEGYQAHVILSWDVLTGHCWFSDISVGMDGAEPTYVGRTFDRQFTWISLVTGVAVIVITPYDMLGRSYPGGSITLSLTLQGASALPDVISGFSAHQNGNLVVFNWSIAVDPNISGYEIRYARKGAATWESGTPVTRVTRGTQLTTAKIPPGFWTFMIAARNTSGAYSGTVASTDLDVGNTNTVLASAGQLPQWEIGALTNLIIHPLNRSLVMASQGMANGDDWTTFDVSCPTPYATYRYESPEITIGTDVLARIYGDVDSVLAPGAIGVADPDLYLETKTTLVGYDGIWELWTVGINTVSAFKARVEISPAIGFTVIRDFVLNADAEKRTETGSSVTILAGGSAVTFGNKYINTPVVTVTVVSSTPAHATVSAITATGFTVNVFNAAGTDVGGTVNWIARGV